MSSPTLHVLPRGIRLTVRPGETLLETLTGAGYRVPSACRNGCCHVCTARWSSGDSCENARLPVDGESVSIRLCLAKPFNDCEIVMPDLEHQTETPPMDVACQIGSITEMGGNVHRVELLPPAGVVPKYLPGQYLQLLIEGQKGAFFSIANAPGERRLELHIQVAPGHESAEAILAALKSETLVKVRLPMGKACFSRIPEGPVLMAAAGTGFAQVKSVYEWLLKQGFKRDIHVFWGVRKTSEFYALPLVSEWEQNENLTCHTVSGDLGDNEWSGHHHELLRVVENAELDWAHTRVLISGSPAMVYALVDLLEAKGVPTDAIVSDVFEYAPRSGGD